MAPVRDGYLTIYSVGRMSIFGEFADGTWRVEESDDQTHNVFSGTASDGAIKTFERLDYDGVSHVEYTFDAEGDRYYGEGELLAIRPDHKILLESSHVHAPVALIQE